MDEKTIKPLSRELSNQAANRIARDWTEEIKLLETRLLELKRTAGQAVRESADGSGMPGGDRSGRALVMKGSLWEQLMYAQLLNSPDKSKPDKERNRKPRNRYDNRLGSGLLPDSGLKR